MCALMCVLAPIALPIGPVPISLATLVVYFSVYVLGIKLGTLSVAAYLLLGFAGLPVFSGYTGGPSKLLGPTGGYLVGYIILALILGVFVEKFTRFGIKDRVMVFVGMAAGTAALYALGTGWLMFSTGMDIGAAMMAGVIPFIPGDIGKMVIAVILAPEVIVALRRAHVLGQEG